MTEDPLVAPTTPGAALQRLLHVTGVLQRMPEVRSEGDELHPLFLRACSDELTTSLLNDDRDAVQKDFERAQTALRRAYETLCQPGILPPNDAPRIFAALRFPDPNATRVGPVDISTVLVSYSKPQRQVLTNISFSDAPGAVGYRLREIRYLNGEELSDDTVSSPTPQFRRVRLPIGEHHFRIESRDPSCIAVSEQFTIQVPQL